MLLNEGPRTAKWWLRHAPAHPRKVQGNHCFGSCSWLSPQTTQLKTTSSLTCEAELCSGLLKGYDSTKRVPKCFYATHNCSSADVRTASFRIFTRIMYQLRIYYSYLPCSMYRGPVEIWAVLPRFLNGTVYSYHGYFRFGSRFMPIFVKFYGSLMMHGYGSVNPRVLNGTV